MIVILPMAGRGTRYKNVGYQTPKPFIHVAGKPMFIWAIESLFQSIPKSQISEIIIIALKEDAEQNQLDLILTENEVNAQTILLEEVTDGQLSTVLKAKNYLNQYNQPFLIIPSDTIVIHKNWENNNNSDGAISVSKQEGTHWSFAKFDDNHKVLAVAEKERISDFASTGWYYFKSSLKFLELAESLIQNQEKTKGEYYIMPLYNKYLKLGLHITAIEANTMHDLGTPESKTLFETNTNEQSE